MDKLIIITPKCCQDVQEKKTVILSYNYEDLFDPENKKPKWKTLGLENSYNSFNLVEANYCPHCATPVPDVKRRIIIDEKISLIEDGGYYCSTCGERCIACTCYPPEYAWEPK